MGKYVNNSKVTITRPYDYDDAVREIAALIGVGKGEDVRHHISDLCVASGINKWAKCKPFKDESTSFDSSEERDAARSAAHHGITLPTPFNAGVSTTDRLAWRTYIGRLATLAMQGIAPNYTYSKPTGMQNGQPFRILDCDGSSIKLYLEGTV